MEERILGRTGCKAGVFAFGGIAVRDTVQAEADRAVAEAVERGVNYFDVAPSYGNAQNILGPALKPYRNGVYLACKTEGRTREAARADLENSLRLLHTDHFNVYQLHGVPPEDAERVTGPGGALEALIEAKEKGLILNIGFSTHYDSVALKLMDAFDFDTILFPVNWACGIRDGLGEAALKKAAERNMGRIAIKALAGRAKEASDDGYSKCWYRPIFDDPVLADLALRYTLSKDVHTAVSPGDVRMLRLGLSIVEKYGGKPPPLSSGEFEQLKKRALETDRTIFAPVA
ncbi:MAG: aldo/keto reductase [Treponema sp.]|jgi:aryl-alcohol dehydrogenase-like predicted oxidoreductase|nr:aldo/keto reductase [Treponema sp.]